jgi:glycosyltransferase involved in cell wall biosynthesis
MKVLYVGVYRDHTGWGRAATDYILALDAAGVDVVPRPLKLNDARAVIPERLLELESRSARGCDVVIQHVLPHQLDYNGRFARNVALFASETGHFRSSVWPERLNTMDQAVVINRQQVAAARQSGVTIPISVVPHASDTDRFLRGYPVLDTLAPYLEAGEFLFYWVGEFVRRKNLAALIKAFHLEFDPAEPVRLVIKTSEPGATPRQCQEHVKKFCGEIRRGLKLHGGDLSRYTQEVVLTERLTEQGMMRLHCSCNCFVMPSYGEAWCIPAFDAMACGNTPIVTACTGFLDYVSEETGWLVPCHEEPVFGVLDSFEDLYVGNETWSAVNIPALRRAMREAFSDRTLKEEKAAKGMERAHDFSYESVGLKFKEALTNEQQQQAGETLDGIA